MTLKVAPGPVFKQSSFGMFGGVAVQQFRELHAQLILPSYGQAQGPMT